MNEISQSWGEEQKIGENYCYGKILKIKKMHITDTYYCKGRIETIIILKGQVLVEIDNDAHMLLRGEEIDILPDQKHSFSALEDSEVALFYTCQNRIEDDYEYKIKEGGKIEKYDIEKLNEKIRIAQKYRK